MDGLKPQLDLIQDATHILGQILQLRAKRAILLGVGGVAVDEDVGLDLVAELAAEVATHELEAVLDVPHVETAHQELLRLLPVVEVLRTPPRHHHQDYQPQTEEVVRYTRLERLHHAQREVVQQLLGQELIATALQDQFVGSEVCVEGGVRVVEEMSVILNSPFLKSTVSRLMQPC
jgi:hypothetical protein